MLLRQSSLTSINPQKSPKSHSGHYNSPNKLALLKQSEQQALQSLIWLKTIKQNRDNQAKKSIPARKSGCSQTPLKSLIQQICPDLDFLNRNRTGRSEPDQKTLKKSTSYHSIRFLKELDYEQGLSTAQNTERTNPETSAKNDDFSKSELSQSRSTSGISASRIEDYQLLKFFGEGSEGAVYLVKHKLTQSLYAMKKIQKSTLNSEAQKNSLVKQIKIHSKLDHPNIVRLYDLFDSEMSIYMVMQFCSGGNLYQLQQKEQKLEEKKVKSIIKQLCEGVAYLHSKNIIHRDLKAENIVIQENVVKICDFGCSSEGRSPRKTLCGTPAYLPPEIVENKFYGQKADIWSLGVLTYELLFGDLPFQVECFQDGSITILENEVNFKSEKVKVSEEAQDFIKSCLCRDPAKRSGMKELLSHAFIKQK